VREKRKDVFAYVNVNAVNIAQKDAGFRDFLNGSFAAYCDGEGVRLGARILGSFLPPRIVLTYWIWDLCALCAGSGLSMFFLGGRETVVAQAVTAARERYPRLHIAGAHHGYFEKSGPENERVVELINGAKPNVLFVGFGMPLQEHWIMDNLQRLEVNAVFPSGSMIDYTAGTRKYAPRWMAGHGMEWCYRLAREPGRLWRRYLIGNPLFLIRIVRQRLYGGSR
jgi:N-acetylglucosaminyldiphosphoundecaprenol N-acetyl-beta-D-mannosaminyltransferase